MDKLQISIDSKVKREFKAIIALQGEEIKEVLVQLIKDYVEKHRHLLGS